MRSFTKSLATIVMAGAIGGAALSGTAWAEDPVGKWTGAVQTPDGDIPMIIKVAKGEDGKLTAIGESPSQAPGMEIPTENVASDGETFSFEVAMAAGSYAGSWDADAKAWVGMWTQNGMDMPLNLSRAD